MLYKMGVVTVCLNLVFLGLSCHEAGYASGSVYLQVILVEGVWNLGEFFTMLVFWCFASSDIFVYL